MSDSVEIKFTDNSIKIKNLIDKDVLKCLEEICIELQSQVEMNTRVDTGETKRAWDHYVKKNEKEGIIGNSLENSIWEELGTGEYAVNSDGRKGAWYVPVDDYLGKNKPTYNGKVVIVYGKNGKAFYKTNGKKPNRALKTAFETTKPKIKYMCEDVFKGDFK